jgi:hypothetical protein
MRKVSLSEHKKLLTNGVSSKSVPKMTKVVPNSTPKPTITTVCSVNDGGEIVQIFNGTSKNFGAIKVYVMFELS